VLGVSVASLLVPRHRATAGTYGGCLAISLISCAIAVPSIAARPSSVILPLGLPWLGAHFHFDPLAAAFLAIVDLGAAAARCRTAPSGPTC